MGKGTIVPVSRPVRPVPSVRQIMLLIFHWADWLSASRVAHDGHYVEPLIALGYKPRVPEAKMLETLAL